MGWELGRIWNAFLRGQLIIISMTILLYTLLLVPAGFAPVALGMAGLAYGVVAAIGGAGMLYCALAIFTRREGVAAAKACWRMFGFSILYLFGLFATILAGHLVAPVLGRLL